jgi:FKBP-type peptidyl-prolyl cis-trans isomerase
MMENSFMPKRVIQLAAIVLCALSACATPSTNPSTTKASPVTQPVVVKHEPVGPPPLVTPAPTTQPVTEPVVARQPTPTPPPPVPPATQPGPVDDRVAYAIGYSAGRRIHDRLTEDGRTANDLMVMRGVLDGLSDRDPAFAKSDVLDAFAEFQAYTQQRRAEKLYADNPSFRKHADENLQKSRALLDQNAEMAGVEVRPDGVQCQLTTPGTGRVVANAKTIGMKHLRISLADGTLVKQSEGDQVESLAAADLLPALINELRGMKVGSKCRIWLPPDKAYGLAGRSPVIGPNQAVEYEFEITSAE